MLFFPDIHMGDFAETIHEERFFGQKKSFSLTHPEEGKCTNTSAESSDKNFFFLPCSPTARSSSWFALFFCFLFPTPERGGVGRRKSFSCLANELKFLTFVGMKARKSFSIHQHHRRCQTFPAELSLSTKMKKSISAGAEPTCLVRSIALYSATTLCNSQNLSLRQHHCVSQDDWNIQTDWFQGSISFAFAKSWKRNSPSELGLTVFVPGGGWVAFKITPSNNETLFAVFPPQVQIREAEKKSPLLNNDKIITNFQTIIAFWKFYCLLSYMSFGSLQFFFLPPAAPAIASHSSQKNCLETRANSSIEWKIIWWASSPFPTLT